MYNLKHNIMKTKNIYQTTTAILAMFVMMLFVFSACSTDDDSDPTYGDSYPPGYVWPADDYPSLTAPAGINSNVGIGDPVPAMPADFR